MRSKLLIVTTMFFLFFLLLSGCKNNEDKSEKIIQNFKNLDSYSCDVDMKIQNDKQTVSYKGKQFYDKRYGYRFELENNRIMVYKDNNIFVKDLKNGFKYSTDKSFDSVFKLSFIGEYIGLIYTNEKIKVSSKTINNKKYEVICLDIPGNNKNISKANLYINVDNEKPEYLNIYDWKDSEKIKVEYSNFNFNRELNKNLFVIE
ncbi:germination lipoprotein GerS-related protein [Clostridium sp. JS66]|uniref:germination lipoprotein GerS-related protein n=1 Tax=Clostridium sp. JS66 TaxID=3064705 RepID=UPI00298D8FB5|nr:germination lipoprotein GerS-related protein [Clostridium sp. JS66]WPC41670.1 germination lipoprotein GerS-related protein [Clostridium sp. JS66]